MTRLIDADAVINGVRNRCLGQNDVIKVELSILSMLDRMPTVDAVPVVRCKDCKRYEPNGKGYHWGHCVGSLCNVDETDYCSKAERRDE